MNYKTLRSPLLIPDTLLHLIKGNSDSLKQFFNKLPEYKIVTDSLKKIFSIAYSDEQVNFECCKKARIYFYRTGRIAGLSFSYKDINNKKDQDQNLLALYGNDGVYSGYLLTGQKDTITCKKKTNINQFEISARTYNSWTIDTFMKKKNIRMSDEEVKKMNLKNGTDAIDVAASPSK